MIKKLTFWRRKFCNLPRKYLKIKSNLILRSEAVKLKVRQMELISDALSLLCLSWCVCADRGYVCGSGGYRADAATSWQKHHSHYLISLGPTLYNYLLTHITNLKRISCIFHKGSSSTNSESTLGKKSYLKFVLHQQESDVFSQCQSRHVSRPQTLNLTISDRKSVV